MSAYVVSDRHISALVKFAAARKVSVYFDGGARVMVIEGNESKVCTVLLNENYRSVNFRYQEQSEPRRIHFDASAPDLTPIEAIKACDGLAYQCSETSAWETTDAHRILQVIKDRAATEIEGYDEAGWSID